MPQRVPAVLRQARRAADSIAVVLRRVSFMAEPSRFLITKPVRAVASALRAASSVAVIGTFRRVRPFGVVV